MKKSIAILANGSIQTKSFHKANIKNHDLLICADGGANHARNLKLIPSYIIGDFDSIENDCITYFKNQHKTNIIEDHNQEKTDLELAIDLAQSLHPDEITIFGALGKRVDHMMANILTLDRIRSDIKAKIIDEKTTIQLIATSTIFKGKKDDILSVIPISEVHDLSYTGLKWDVSDLNIESGWFGISNRFQQSTVSISFSKGKLIIIQVRQDSC